MKPKTKIIFSNLLIIGLFALSSFAQADFVQCGGVNEPECKITDLLLTLMNIINFLLSWAWMVAILFIVWAGWGMIGSGGNEEKVAAAKTTFSHAIIGFFLILASFILANLIVSLLSGNGLPRAGALLDAFNLVSP